ncbi:hypothetical protein [Crocosphaera sp.]|nr:hypothetical protein [Crocosphaera sp.]
MSLQLGESPVTSNTMNQTANRVTVERLETPSDHPRFGKFTVAQK